jgi:hypothetical protein
MNSRAHSGIAVRPVVPGAEGTEGALWNGKGKGPTAEGKKPRPLRGRGFQYALFELGKGRGRTPTREHERGETAGNHAALMAIFFSAFCASALFGTVTFSTPFLKDASILS